MILLLHFKTVQTQVNLVSVRSQVMLTEPQTTHPNLPSLEYAREIGILKMNLVKNIVCSKEKIA